MTEVIYWSSLRINCLARKSLTLATPMQNAPKPQSKSPDSERDRLRQELLRRIVKNEAERRAGPQAKS
jgi:hypothetical protein